ncbi:sororin [Syngnathoides biaculeatus]|uniref:sororin n=1 Tax=Syngnathoides biaculeatus TaxID=300417 RepID=UPI002ADE3FF3|nr:sororin [Syngnathoides biaculeatus]
MADYNKLNDSSQRRRSPRLTPSLVNTENNMAHGVNVPVKRSITVRKIVPRKTAPVSEHNKENTPRRPEDQQKRQKISTPGPVRTRPRSLSAKKKVVVPSPILPPSTPVQTRPQQPAEDTSYAVWSQKVRRSYTRIGDKSFNSPESRETLFGFEMLQTPEVGQRVEQGKASLEVSSISSGPSSFILDTEDCVPDLNIPGVSLLKEKKKSRRKVQQIDVTELEMLSAKMNAEFQEAEQFELVVE